MVARDTVADARAVTIRAFVNGVLRQEGCSRDLIRPVPQLIADVCEFMTLLPGDILLVGVPENPPLARAGDSVRVEVQGVGQIENRIVAEEVDDTGAPTI
jgi:5-oxopent-3-ene-1,2,5-tricarboxylate decarboxylase/2-hydroxyhepta-2,4-diene-1,7-dioate isomerase